MSLRDINLNAYMSGPININLSLYDEAFDTSRPMLNSYSISVNLDWSHRVSLHSNSTKCLPPCRPNDVECNTSSSVEDQSQGF
jgi:hypothetical protein